MNGLLLVDKPSGLTSHDVVARVRRILGLRAVGHAGTLDPAASGLLVLLLGEGTKISDYVLSGEKGYEVKVRLGRRTDTLDRDGTVIEENEVKANADEIRAAASKLRGVLSLPVPAHSAVKVHGKKLYEYARKDQKVEIPIREMDFRTVEVLDVAPPLVTIALQCSKGSYIRAWAEKLGQDLGCGGMVEELRRTISAPYAVEEAISLEKLEEIWKARDARDAGILGTAWVPLKDTLPAFRTLRVDGPDEALMTNGQISRNLQTKLLSFVTGGERPPGVKVISSATDDVVSLLWADEGQFYKIRRVFRRA